MSSTGPLPGAEQLRVRRQPAPPARRVVGPPPPAPVQAPSRRRVLGLGVRALRGLVVFAVWTCLGISSGLTAAVAAPVLLGAKPMMVRSGSMEPLIHTGDLVVVRAIAPEAVQIGDVVTFRDPKNTGRLLTHRVRDLRIEGAHVTVRTKGDAVTGSETWTVPRSGTIGRVEYRVWKAGYVIAWVRTPAALLAAGAVAAMVLGGWVLVGVWRGD